MTDVMAARSPHFYIINVTTIPLPARPISLRPLALPTEHGGWGFLLEPIALGLLVAPSWRGALIALAALFAFLARQPLKLALQDAIRGKIYPRTRYCRAIAASYLIVAAIAIFAARMLLPVALIAPLALVQMGFDAKNRSRALFAEMCGAIAMSSIAAMIAIADGTPITVALGLSGIIIARSLPSILYVRALLRGAPKWPVIVAHALAIVFVASYASWFAVAAMIILLARAIHGVMQAFQPAPRTIGWREIVYGAITVGLAGAS